jgi:hypothetical protein
MRKVRKCDKLEYLQFSELICGTYFRIAHLCKFATGINNTSGTGGKFNAGVIDTGGVL